METLDRAERWLRHVGFTPGQMEVHREGTPWISVLAAPGRSAEAEMIFRVAELLDPDGWPSFWDLAKIPHPRIEPVADVTETTVATARPAPLGWHPPTESDPDAYGVTEVWDVQERFP